MSASADFARHLADAKRRSPHTVRAYRGRRRAALRVPRDRPAGRDRNHRCRHATPLHCCPTRRGARRCQRRARTLRAARLHRLGARDRRARRRVDSPARAAPQAPPPPPRHARRGRGACRDRRCARHAGLDRRARPGGAVAALRQRAARRRGAVADRRAPAARRNGARHRQGREAARPSRWFRPCAPRSPPMPTPAPGR